jgi:hypothetical protein
MPGRIRQDRAAPSSRYRNPNLDHESGNTGDDESTETGLSLVGSSSGHSDRLLGDLSGSLGLGRRSRGGGGLLGLRSGRGGGRRCRGRRCRLGLGSGRCRLRLGSRGQGLGSRSLRGGHDRGQGGGDGARAVCLVVRQRCYTGRAGK